MSTTTRQLTSYFRDVQQRSNLVDQPFNDKVKHLVFPREDLIAGTLSDKVTREVLQWNEEAQVRFRSKKGSARQQGKQKPIDVIISVATLTDNESNSKTGLALIAAKLSEEGELQADINSTTPWIPSSRLQSPGVQDLEFMVGELAGYWKWCNNKGGELASKVESWKDVVDYATSMYEGVSDPALQEELDSRWSVDLENCYITPGTIIKANVQVLNLYQFLGTKNKPAPLYKSLLALKKPKDIQSDTIDTEANVLLESASSSCGSMSDGFPLTASQRRAVHAFMHDGYGDVTAVSGPPGTGKTTMLQSVVASMLVCHALEGKPAPLIVGMSTNNQAVTNIIDSFGSVTKDDPGVLEHRWLLKVEDGEAASTSLGGLATYCPSQAKVKEAREKGYLLEDTGKRGVYAEYSDPSYVEVAKQHFLQQISEYYSTFSLPPVDSLTTAGEGLASFLSACDQARLTLLEGRSEADALVSETGERLTAEVVRLAQEQQYAETRYQVWADSSQSPLPPELIVSTTYDAQEPAPQSQTPAAFIDFYRDRLSTIALEIIDINSRIKVAQTEEERANQYYKQKAEGIINSVRALAVLSEKQSQKLLEANNLLELDQALDTTLRYAEFWLAVHYYEADWLLTALDEEKLIPANERFKNTPDYMKKYWQQVTSLTPCFVMTTYQVPKYFNLYAKPGEPAKFDLERINLLIVDEAGQVDTSIGAANFALAQRALVVGDVQQLAPVWSIDGETDHGIANAHGLADRWEEMNTYGLTSSQPSSLMKAAANSSNWTYSNKNYPGLFLSEHFRCHTDIIEYCNDLLYDGLLIPSRPLGGYKLKGKTPHAFLFQEVDNSQDRRNGSSRVNDKEAEAIADWIIGNFDYFRSIYNPGFEIEKDKTIFAVVTPFSAQARVIKKTFRQKNAGIAELVTVGTAHTLQGAERQVVLFSPVYGENSGKASFIDSTLELMNVAVSRAKDLFIVFGGKNRWDDSGPVFSQVRQRAVKGRHWFGSDMPGISEDVEPVEVAADRTKNHVPTAVDAGSIWAPTIVAPPPQPINTPAEQDAPAQQLGSSTGVAVEAKMVDRHEPGYLIATELIRVWKEQKVLPENSSAKAQLFNSAMDQAGLLTKDSGPWEPTPEGIALGIAVYQGGSGNNTYISPIYSPQAQEALTQMVRSGNLVI